MDLYRHYLFTVGPYQCGIYPLGKMFRTACQKGGKFYSFGVWPSIESARQAIVGGVREGVALRIVNPKINSFNYVRKFTNRYEGKGAFEAFRKRAEKESSLKEFDNYVSFYNEYATLAHEGKAYPTERLYTTVKELSPYIKRLRDNSVRFLRTIPPEGGVDLMDVVVTRQSGKETIAHLSNFLKVAKEPRRAGRLNAVIQLDTIMALVHSGFAELPSSFKLRGRSYSMAQDVAMATLNSLAGEKPKPLKIGTMTTGVTTEAGWIPNAEFIPSSSFKPYRIKEEPERWALAPNQKLPRWWKKEWGIPPTKKHGNR